jgi:uncharacterized protein YjbI with pentapeptide repeats
MTENAPTAASAIDWARPRFAGQSFVLGGFKPTARKGLAALIEREGGTVAQDVTAAVTFALVPVKGSSKPSGVEKKAFELIHKKAAPVRLIDEKEFYALYSPNRDEALAMLRAGPEGVGRWNQLRPVDHRPLLDLRGADLRGARLAGAWFWDVDLGGADFREADLTEARFGQVADVRFTGAVLKGATCQDARRCDFEGARLNEAYLTDLADCRFVGADLAGATVDEGTADRCDFSGARMQGFRGPGITTSGLVLAGADLAGADLSAGTWDDADFRQADLCGANLTDSNLRGANLSGARLGKAILVRANLKHADLTWADLRQANLIDAILSHAVIDGANFEGAVLTGTRVGELDVTRALGLDPQAPEGPRGQSGPSLRKLDEVLKESNRIETTVILDLPEGPMDLAAWGNGGNYPNTHLYAFQGKAYVNEYGRTLAEVMFEKTRRWAHGTPRPESVTARAGSKCPVDAVELRRLALAAWCEAFGVAVPAPDVLAEREAALEAERAEQRRQLLQLLRGGPDGVTRWNARSFHERLRSGAFGKVDLGGADLAGANLAGLDFSGSNFEGARLVKANLHGNFQQAQFSKADLAEVEGGNFGSADFTGATLVRAVLQGSSLRKARFPGADLTEADLIGADLCGADLSAAVLTGVRFVGAKYDGKTRFPVGWTLQEGMKWAGRGTNPHLPGRRPVRGGAGRGPAGPAAPIDLDTFLQRLRGNVETGRLGNALQMLKQDRFQLYAQADDEALVGVVKSQTDPDLVYACRLAALGQFACCTHKLNPCGGLRGKLCKHLLVLIVGLAKKGQLDLARIDQWVADSKLMKPALDKETMGEVLLRYKSAEAGEIDWRPTETIPEDFYTL